MVAIAVLVAGAGPVGATNPAPKVPTGRLSGLRYHVVKKGDTLGAISAWYGVRMSTIRSANGMPAKGASLYAGYRLLLDEPNPGRMTPESAPVSVAPPTTAPAATYKVRAGDTLARIARHHRTTIDALSSANELASADLIRIGQVLNIVPPGTAPAVAPEAPPTACPLPGSTFTFDWGSPRGDGARFHEGIDMFAPAGTPILAPVAGTVSYGASSMSGTFATLKGTNGWQYFAAHMSKTAKAGTVKAGDVIGYVGSSGDADGGPSHLHLEIRPLSGRPINPFPVVSAACKR